MGRGALLALLWAPTALAAPEHLRLTACGPLDSAPCVLWNDPTGGGSEVQYGFDQSLPLSSVADAWLAEQPIGTVHRAQLEALSGYSEYLYRVGGGGGAISPTFTLRTPPKTGEACLPMAFAVLGNSKSETNDGTSAAWSTVLSEAFAKQPSFLLHTGHVVKDGSKPAQWKDFLSRSGDTIASLPLVVAPSELDLAGDGELFEAVLHGGAPETRNVAFTAGDAVVAVIDTELTTGAQVEATGAWLDQVLTDNPRRWKFVVMHRPAYSAFGAVGVLEFGARPNEVNQNGVLVPIFDEHHVDVVFQGRGNFYQRLGPMRFDPQYEDQGDPVDSPADGTVYVVSGGAGSITLAPFEIGSTDVDPLAEICDTASGSVVCAGKQHFVVVRLDKNKLELEAWATSTQNDSTGPENVELLDSLVIEKQDAIWCAGDPWPDQEPDAGPVEPDSDVAVSADVAIAEPVEPEDVHDDVNQPEPEPAVEPAPDASSGSDLAPASDLGPQPDVVFGADLGTPASDDGGCTAGGGSVRSRLPLLLLSLLALFAARRR